MAAMAGFVAQDSAEGVSTTSTGFADLPPECLDLVLSFLRGLRPQVFSNCVRLVCKDWLESCRRLSTTLVLIEGKPCKFRSEAAEECAALNRIMSRYPKLSSLRIEQKWLLSVHRKHPLSQRAWRSVELSSAEYHQLTDIGNLPYLLDSSWDSLEELAVHCGSGDFRAPNPINVHRALEKVIGHCAQLKAIRFAHMDPSQGYAESTSQSWTVGSTLHDSRALSVDLKGALVGTDLLCIDCAFPNVEVLRIEDTNMDEGAVHRKAFYRRERARREKLRGFAFENLRVLEYRLKLRSEEYEAHWALYTKEALKGRLPKLELLVTHGHSSLLPLWKAESWCAVIEEK